MNAQTAANVNMMKTVKKTVDADMASYEVIPIFLTLYLKMCDNLAEIETLDLVAVESTKPTTKQKNSVLDDLCKAAQLTARLVRAYAVSAGNVELAAQMDIKAYKIKKLTGQEQVSSCQNISDTATEYLKPAEPFGLTQAILNNFNNLLGVYKTDIPEARTQQGNIDTAKKNIERLEAENLNILDNLLDPAVESLYESNPSAVERWRFARKVLKPHTTHTTLKVILKDEESKAPLAEVPVTASGKNTFIATTNAEGEALWRPFPFGVYNISVNLPAYLPYVQKKFKVVKGKVNRIEAFLKAAPVAAE